MTTKKRTNFGAILAIFLGCFLFTCVTCKYPSAKASSDTNRLTVTPAIIESEVSNDGGKKSFSITVDNSSDSAVDFTVELRSVEQEIGLLVPLPTASNMSGAVNLSPQLLSVPVHGSSSFILEVTHPELISPGGNYAAVVLSETSSSSGALSLNKSVSIPVFIIKRDGAIQSYDLSGVRVSGSIFSAQRRVTATVKDTGNTPIRPAIGVLTSVGGKTIAKSTLNIDSSTLLQGQTKTYSSTTTKVGGAYLPTTLLTTITVRLGKQDTPQSVTIKHLYIPPIFVGSVLLVFVLAIVSMKLVSRLSKRRPKPTKKTKVDAVVADQIPVRIIKTRPVEKEPRKIPVK